MTEKQKKTGKIFVFLMILVVFLLLVIQTISRDIQIFPYEIGVTTLLDLYLVYHLITKRSSRASFIFWFLVFGAIFDMVYLFAVQFDTTSELIAFHPYLFALLIGAGLWLHPRGLRVLQKRYDDAMEIQTIRKVVALKQDKPSSRKRWVIAGLFGVIAVSFIVVRLPYFNDSFFIRFHPGKYVSYVPAAREMYEARNPFVSRNQAYTSVVGTTGEQQYKSFWRLPVLEWTLAPFFVLEDMLSEEAIVRIYLTILGLALLFNLFLLIRKIFSTFAAFGATFLCALTPLMQLITWTTTLDLSALIFLLIAVNLFLRDRKESAYLMVGFAFLCKVSFVLIGLPLFGFLILFTEKQKIIAGIKFMLLSLVPFGLFLLLLRGTPAHPERMIHNILLVLGYIGTLATIYWLAKYPLTRLLHFLQARPKIWMITLAVLSVLALVFGMAVFQGSLEALGNQFLTDPTLVFLVDFYRVLLDRIRLMSLPMVTLLFIVSVIAFRALSRRQKQLLLPWALSSLIFLIVASKSIRFAWYYNHVFILTMTLFISGFLFQVEKLLSGKRAVRIIVLVSLLFLASFSLNPKPAYVLEGRINQESITQLAHLIDEHTNPNEKVLIYSSTYRVLFLYTGRPFISLGSVTDPQDLQQLRQNINQLGFVQAMMRYHIRLMVDGDGQDNLISLTYLFSDTVDKIATDRTSLIVAKLFDDVEYYDYSIQELYQAINPRQYFQEIGSVGGVTVYEISSPPVDQ